MIGYVADIVFTEEIYQTRERTTLILSEPWEQIVDDDRVLLQKILQSVKLTLDHVVVIHQPTFNLGALNVRPRQVIYFGAPVNGLTPFELITVDGTSVILAPSLKLLHADAGGKQKLWAALKILFGR